MSKSKNKKKLANKKKKQKAHHRKLDAAEELSDIGIDLSDEIYNIGIIFNNLTISHLTYVGLNYINKICTNYVGIDICLFVEQLSRPCIQPQCAVGEIKDLFNWRQPLIATDINTCIYALNSPSQQIYYYVFDIEFINNYTLSWDIIKRCFYDPRITLIARHSDHKKLIEDEFNIKISNMIIEDFDLVSMIRLIIKDIKNGTKTTVKT